MISSVIIIRACLSECEISEVNKMLKKYSVEESYGSSQ